MIDRWQERYEVEPAETLMGGGHTAHATGWRWPAGRRCARRCRVEGSGADARRPKATNPLAIAQRRKWMRTTRAKRNYKEGTATAECANAQALDRGSSACWCAESRESRPSQCRIPVAQDKTEALDWLPVGGACVKQWAAIRKAGVSIARTPNLAGGASDPGAGSRTVAVTDRRVE